jgi:hypothetical protein
MQGLAKGTGAWSLTCPWPASSQRVVARRNVRTVWGRPPPRWLPLSSSSGHSSSDADRGTVLLRYVNFTSGERPRKASDEIYWIGQTYYSCNHVIGLPLNKGQDFGFTPNKGSDRIPLLEPMQALNDRLSRLFPVRHEFVQMHALRALSTHPLSTHPMTLWKSACQECVNVLEESTGRPSSS